MFTSKVASDSSKASWVSLIMYIIWITFHVYGRSTLECHYILVYTCSPLNFIWYYGQFYIWFIFFKHRNKLQKNLLVNTFLQQTSRRWIMSEGRCSRPMLQDCIVFIPSIWRYLTIKTCSHSSHRYYTHAGRQINNVFVLPCILKKKSLIWSPLKGAIANSRWFMKVSFHLCVLYS